MGKWLIGLFGMEQPRVRAPSKILPQAQKTHARALNKCKVMMKELPEGQVGNGNLNRLSQLLRSTLPHGEKIIKVAKISTKKRHAVLYKGLENDKSECRQAMDQRYTSLVG